MLYCTSFGENHAHINHNSSRIGLRAGVWGMYLGAGCKALLQELGDLAELVMFVKSDWIGDDICDSD